MWYLGELIMMSEIIFMFNIMRYNLCYKKIVSYCLLFLNIIPMIISPMVVAFPLLEVDKKYEGDDNVASYYGMHFSPEVKNNIRYPVQEYIYLHIYKGVKPSNTYIKEIDIKIKEIDNKLKIKIFTSIADYQKGQYRILIGPVDISHVKKYSKQLKQVGIDNFPVRLVEDSAGLTTPLVDRIYEHEVRHSKKTQTITPFKYSDELSLVANTLSGVESNSDLINKAKAYVKDEVQRCVASNIQDYLYQYGTAKVDVLFDSDFKLKSGEVDVLFPFNKGTHGKTSSTWFVQPGLVINDNSSYSGRDFVHVGIGYREKNDSFFYGLNTFYDYDLSRNHQRASVGMEYARGFFSFSQNYYFPLTDWKDSPDSFDSLANVPLEERPAQGFDINLKGYLPQYPYLSLSTQYQQFFGQNIEVSNGDSPIKNPYQLDATINYQPIPLLTFSSGYSYEKGGKQGMVFGGNFIYRFGVPISKQLDPNQVYSGEFLNINLFDIVERENNVRLEYRKKKLDLDLEITFKKSSYDLLEGQSIELSKWLSISGDESKISDFYFEKSAKEFIKQSTTLSKSQFIAPIYNKESNRFNLSIAAKLFNGQIIKTPMDAIINVIEDVEVFKPSIVITRKYGEKKDEPEVADGKHGYIVTLVLKNRSGRYLSGVPVHFDVNSTTAIVSNTDCTTNSEGLVSVEVVDTVSEIMKLVFSVQNIKQPIPLEFIADKSTADITKSDVVVVTNNMVANGIAKNVVKVTLKDAKGNAVANEFVRFPKVEGLAMQVRSEKTDANGEVMVDITSTRASTYQVNAEHNGKQKAVGVTFIRTSPRLDTVTVVGNKKAILASESLEIKVHVKDQLGYDYKRAEVVYASSSSSFEKSVVTDDNGYTVIKAYPVENEDSIEVRVRVVGDDAHETVKANVISQFFLRVTKHANYWGGVWYKDGLSPEEKKILYFSDLYWHEENVLLPVSTTEIKSYVADPFRYYPGGSFVVTDEMRRHGGFCHQEGDFYSAHFICDVNK
ncbi:inverse autotransporter beta domain-containing protein [Aliivibrio fischeri]|uniref:inverse autotransporter beta domain-containing protein n=1 Tax=Aliivibrio fischeri TaxID=668 RepID=UPI0018C7ACE8|nr:inverse autotransporter beta domain-containing protein [Aliivibrio fischeri]